DGASPGPLQALKSNKLARENNSYSFFTVFLLVVFSRTSRTRGGSVFLGRKGPPGRETQERGGLWFPFREPGKGEYAEGRTQLTRNAPSCDRVTVTSEAPNGGHLEIRPKHDPR